MPDSWVQLLNGLDDVGGCPCRSASTPDARLSGVALVVNGPDSMGKCWDADGKAVACPGSLPMGAKVGLALGATAAIAAIVWRTMRRSSTAMAGFGRRTSRRGLLARLSR